MPSARRVVVGLSLGVAALGACRSSKSGGAAGAPSASGPAAVAAAPSASSPYAMPVERVLVDAGPLASGIPVPQAQVDATLNPKRLAPYAGPVGTVTGVVRVSGDPPPKTDVRIPARCAAAGATYGRLYREGVGRALADALVAVTAYDGFVPPRSEIRPVRLADCAYEARTIDATYGQRLEVRNLGDQAMLPELVGARHPAELVALPHGDPVQLYPTSPGHYVLSEGTHDFIGADVFVLRYPTHAVTGLDGAFRIEGVPVGTVKLSAMLPVTGRTVERTIDVREGDNPPVELTIPFDAKKDVKKPAAPAVSGLPQIR